MMENTAHVHHVAQEDCRRERAYGNRIVFVMALVRLVNVNVRFHGQSVANRLYTKDQRAFGLVLGCETFQHFGDCLADVIAVTKVSVCCSPYLCSVVGNRVNETGEFELTSAPLARLAGYLLE